MWLGLDIEPFIEAFEAAQWGLAVWMWVMLGSIGFALFMLLRYEWQRRTPVDRIIRDRRFGGV